MSDVHTVVWLDHREARVVELSGDEVHTATVRHEGAPRKVHHRAGTRDSPGYLEDMAGFFDAIADAVGDARRIVIAGPGQAKNRFRRHVERRRRDFARRVVGIETLARSSDRELASYAKRCFGRTDRVVGLPGSV